MSLFALSSSATTRTTDKNDNVFGCVAPFGDFTSDFPARLPQKTEPNSRTIIDSTEKISSEERYQNTRHLYVLPVLLLEFLALAITRAVIPSMLLEYFGDGVYFVMGCAEFVRGLLAFLACPLFGKISDVIGRRVCLFVTVLGTCSPVCALALMPVSSVHRIWVFVILLGLSGLFSSTFTLTFAYISDTVPKKDRVSAYGLALATFGLSFTIGPMAGGYLSRVEDGNIEGDNSSMREYDSDSDIFPVVHPLGQQRVFWCALGLTILDLLYIYFILPEKQDSPSSDDNTVTSMSSHFQSMQQEILPQCKAWSPLDPFQIFLHNDTLLKDVSKIAFLYYTSVSAVISTLILYAAKRFHLGPERLGELMSTVGLCTMLAEAVLVRIIVPQIGEKRTMRLGLIAFTCQCVVLGLANKVWHLFLCVAFSMLGNLVYPSLTSLISGEVEPDTVGEVLGAVNGIKALTEGVAPLIFGTLLTVSEKGYLPGWPYLVAALFVIEAYRLTDQLPDEDDEDYSTDLHGIQYRIRMRNNLSDTGIMDSILHRERHDQEEMELCGLLSEIETDDDTSTYDQEVDRHFLN